MSAERIVIVAYKPLPGKEKKLLALTKSHYKLLHKEGLVSDRLPVIMKAADGTIVEVFGWKSGEAMKKAHSNPVVQDMWGDYAGVCEYIPIGRVMEAGDLFSEFDPVN